MKNNDVVQLDDFTRDGFRTVILDADGLDPKQFHVLRHRARKAGYEYLNANDEQGRLVFSTKPADDRVGIP